MFKISVKVVLSGLVFSGIATGFAVEKKAVKASAADKSKPVKIKTTEENLDKIRKYLNELKKKAESGDAEAQGKLAGIYRNGGGKLIKQNFAECQKWAQKSADQDNPLGYYNLGMLYKGGLGVKKDERKGKELLAKAGLLLVKKSSNSSNAKYQLADICRALGYPNPAVGKLLLLAGSGDSLSQFRLARLYMIGASGIKKDHDEVKKYLEMAAGRGFFPALVTLASSYRSGINGFPKDEEKAKYWMTRARDVRKAHIEKMRREGKTIPNRPQPPTPPVVKTK